MNVTTYVLNVAASALLAGSVWAQNPSQNPSSSQMPQTRRDSRPGLLAVYAPRAPFRPTQPKGRRSSR